ncbi:MAG: hypothetical protein ACK4UN_16390, partial [Limisphaerales bacterium]
PDPADPAKMVVGKSEHPHPWRMWKSLREAGFFRVEREHYVVPDSSYETIMATWGSEKAVRSWHGSLKPGFGGDINTDEQYRQFVEMWQKSMAGIEQLNPKELKPAEAKAANGFFRGYNLASPGKTPWLRPGR